jgi:hypothetical protein
MKFRTRDKIQSFWEEITKVAIVEHKTDTGRLLHSSDISPR